ncbi:MAG: DnaJ family molecular chaperone [Rhizobiales bacterium]|nr:DnaJ family molecular chaperone [Hyphomicrobiales bacterium]
MSIWTRIAESISATGYSIGGFLTKLARSRATAPEKSIAFTIGMIALGAKMAKADGIVTQGEINAFKQVFHVPTAELAAVARVFNLAKQDVAGFDSYARQIARLFKTKSAVLEDVLDGLFHIAKADDALHPAEIGFLEAVALIFGFSETEFDGIKSRHVAGETIDPYRLLGVERTAPLDAIKQRYRKLVRANHPDRHIAAGVPEEMIALATGRLQGINEAYGRIMKERAT